MLWLWSGVDTQGLGQDWVIDLFSPYMYNQLASSLCVLPLRPTLSHFFIRKPEDRKHEGI